MDAEKRRNVCESTTVNEATYWGKLYYGVQLYVLSYAILVRRIAEQKVLDKVIKDG